MKMSVFILICGKRLQFIRAALLFALFCFALRHVNNLYELLLPILFKQLCFHLHSITVS